MSAEDTEPVEGAGEGLVEEGVGVGVWDEVGEIEFDTGAFEGDIMGFDEVEDVYVPAGGV
jgi:hypothetical protein